MIGVFDLFKIGIGPSSSHTVGPMKAALAFATGLPRPPARIVATLFGSLAWTGVGHGTDRAVVLGLAGERPETVDAEQADAIFARATESRRLALLGRAEIGFDPATDLVFDRLSPTPTHPNTLLLAAFDETGVPILEERWCSVGGGFVVREAEIGTEAAAPAHVPHPFRSGVELLERCAATGLSIAALVRENEHAVRAPGEVAAHLAAVHATMMQSIDRGMATPGHLPGKLRVRRRAPALQAALEDGRNDRPPHEIMDRVSLYAIAVNEENAAGGRVVTAPTNGAAGVVPAVLRYYRDHVAGASARGADELLLTAAAIGALFKMNASISGAEVGCQGEVGVACSMAAAGLAAALGGTPEQVENAAEIGMEHHLGMTCDPIGGLVQIPCIERNAFGAIKAINAASLALHGDGTHVVSLDTVIATMRQTGRDMHSKYKETSQGGLAVSFPEC